MIKKVNVIIVFNALKSHVLMCYRTKDPYKGLYNFVGGKIEMGESNLDAAYRELFEETGITKESIDLTPLFTTVYHVDNIELQVYYGLLTQDVTLVPEKHPLEWIALAGENFADDHKFAGQGNIKHMLDIILESKQVKGLNQETSTIV